MGRRTLNHLVKSVTRGPGPCKPQSSRSAADVGWAEDFSWLIEAEGIEPASAAPQFVLSQKLEISGAMSSAITDAVR